MKIKTYNILLLLAMVLIGISSCSKDEQVYEETRLFRPVLATPLMTIGNEIVVNLGKLKEATGYKYELSRDSFSTIDFTIESDTNQVTLGQELLGKQLFWNTPYQVRVTAHAADPQFDSRPAFLGETRTQRFPSILNAPSKNDVTDTKARVTWVLAGAAVTKIKTFAGDDLGLDTPLKEYDVDGASQQSGEAIITGLDPETSYQIAIYSNATLRGWVDYRTFVAQPNLDDANVINLTENENPSAVKDAVTSAADGQIIMVKRGVQYDLPNDPLDKSITIRGAYGFGPDKAILYTTGNWNFAAGVSFDHVRFVDLEIRGEDSGGDYVFNPSISGATNVNEISFTNCFVTNLRGVLRIRGDFFVNNFIIENSIVSVLGNYGIFTADTDGDNKAACNNFIFKNSTFSKMNRGLTSRQNSKTVVIESCTFNEFAEANGYFMRWRGSAGFDNVTEGITMKNNIFGHGWDQSNTNAYTVPFIGGGLGSTTFTLVNNYATSEFSPTAGSELAGFPSQTYPKSAKSLWKDPYEGNDFTIIDNSFSGRLSSGDPRWRPKF